jgi:hypothetical protein
MNTQHSRQKMQQLYDIRNARDTARGISAVNTAPPAEGQLTINPGAAKSEI